MLRLSDKALAAIELSEQRGRRWTTAENLAAQLWVPVAQVEPPLSELVRRRELVRTWPVGAKGVARYRMRRGAQRQGEKVSCAS